MQQDPQGPTAPGGASTGGGSARDIPASGTHQGIPALDAALAGLLAHSRTPIQDIVSTRVLVAIGDLIEHLPEQELVAAAAESDNTTVLARLFTSNAALAVLRRADPLAPARLRWLRSRDELLGAEGGAAEAPEVMQQLGLKTRQALHARLTRKQLIGLPLGPTRTVYPRWQFDTKQRNGMLVGIDRTLAVLADQDGWGQALFMLGGEARLGGERPLDLLRRGSVEPVVIAALHYGEQGGG